MKKIIILLLLCVVVCFGFAACTGDDEEQFSEKAVSLYFANAEYIETGDESVGLLVNYATAQMQEEKPDPLGTIEMLREVPEDLEGAETAVNERYTFNGVEVKEGTAYVDVASEGLTGGSLEEMLFVSQIVETLIASYDEIQQVQFLVDGEVAETLMGHIDATEVFTSGIEIE